MYGLAAPFELYYAERVKATQNSLEEEFTYNNRKIWISKIMFRKITGTKKGSDEPRMVPE
jgi:hypothetical protein